MNLKTAKQILINTLAMSAIFVPASLVIFGTGVIDCPSGQICPPNYAGREMAFWLVAGIGVAISAVTALMTSGEPEHTAPELVVD